MDFDVKIEGKLQIIAAIALLQESLLVHFDKQTARFKGVDKKDFENRWQKKFNPIVDRLLCWIAFSTGAEFLVKGVCLSQGIDIRPNKTTDKLGEFGKILNDKPEKSFLETLRHKGDFKIADRDYIWESYKNLKNNIRNRDVHAYRPNVREDDFDQFRDEFIGAFNKFLCWCSLDSSKLKKWKTSICGRWAHFGLNSPPLKHLVIEI